MKLVTRQIEILLDKISIPGNDTYVVVSSVEDGGDVTYNVFNEILYDKANTYDELMAAKAKLTAADGSNDVTFHIITDDQLSMVKKGWYHWDAFGPTNQYNGGELTGYNVVGLCMNDSTYYTLDGKLINRTISVVVLTDDYDVREIEKKFNVLETYSGDDDQVVNILVNIDDDQYEAYCKLPYEKQTAYLVDIIGLDSCKA